MRWRTGGVIENPGNGDVVRIPASVLEAVDVRLDQPGDVRVEDGSIVIGPVAPPCDILDALVAEIVEENRHDLIDTGAPVDR